MAVHLESPAFQFVIRPEQAAWDLYGNGEHDPAVVGARVSVAYRCGRPAARLSAVWAGPQVSAVETVASPQGPLRQVSIQFAPEAQGLRLRLVFALPEGQPLALWKLVAANQGSQPVMLDRLELLGPSGGAAPVERGASAIRNLAPAVHHVTVHDIGGQLSVSLDLEVDRKLTLGSAHDIADQLEAALREELGPDVEVETHIEPLQPPEAAGRDAPPERVRAVEITLAETAAEVGMIGDVHNVRVRETDEGEIVNFHCRVNPVLSVQAVHEKVDEVERELRRRSPSIKRVIGHAEPRAGRGAASR